MQALSLTYIAHTMLVYLDVPNGETDTFIVNTTCSVCHSLCGAFGAIGEEK